MSLTLPEDAATVLEQFVHDVANIPAEINHLLEEIEAKDRQIFTYKEQINKHDFQLQKWVRTNGGHVSNPKDEAISKAVSDWYDRCEIMQAEKCGLSEKASIILDRQIRRLDIGLRSLMQTEQFPADWGGPSLLTSHGNANGPAASTTTNPGPTIPHMPLQAVSGNVGAGVSSTSNPTSTPASTTTTTGGAPNIANAAQIRLAQSTGASNSARASVSGTSTPVNPPRSQREGSSEAAKRRRLNAPLGTIPMPPSGLRQTSLGPGTPKAGTPVPVTSTSSRAGSAQPTRPTASQKKAPSSNPGRKIAPPPSRKSGVGRVRNAGTKKGDRRRQLARDRATPSTNASNSASEDEGSASPTPSSLPRSQGDGTGDKGDDEDGDDDQIYCICQKVSFGDMVGCDNDDCEYQWFHYKCVGVTEEPVGEWLCPTCRTLPKSKLKISKD